MVIRNKPVDKTADKGTLDKGAAAAEPKADAKAEPAVDTKGAAAAEPKAEPKADAGVGAKKDAPDATIETAEEAAIADAAVTQKQPVVRTGTTAVATTGKFVAAYTQYENALPPVEFGILPRLKASGGQIKDGDGGKLGTQVVIKLVSFNKQFVMSPNDDDAPNDSVGYSYDGETETNTGMSVVDFMAALKATYPKANIKEYYEVVGMLEEATNETEHIDGMIQIQLSPQSRKDFEAFRLQQSVKESMGKVDLTDARILVTAQEKSFGTKEYTKLHFSIAG